MVQTRAQKARQQAQNIPVESEQRPGQQLEQGTGEQPGQRSAPGSRGSNTVSFCDTPVVQNVRGQKSTIEKAHNPVQTTRLRIGTLEVEDAIETVDNSNPIALWINEGRWTGNKYLGSDMEPLTESEYSESLSGRKRQDTGTPVTRSSAKSQAQSVPYASPRYELRLAKEYCFLTESELGVAEGSKVLYKSLLELKQIYPENSLLGDDVFAKTLEDLQGRNEVHIIRKIGHLIVPSANDFAIEGANHLDILEETFYEGWNNSIPLTGARPQPDYSVGFNKAAFTSLQLTRLSPFVLGIPGGSTDRSYFMATNKMFFPFLACEVKSEMRGGLITAGRQNAHSMTLAVRGILALFRLVKRDHELNREILAFSISHDSEMALIYGHYGTIDEDGKVRYYRHKIANFDFLAHDGRDRWKAYQFTKNVYDVWMPTHLGRIRAVIDQLSDDRDFEVSKLSGSTSLPQNLQAMAGLEGEEVTASLPVDTGYESNQGREGDIPTASPTTPSPCKKQKTWASQS
ncbi:hypothetical protein G7054_g5961 [Neopestalotiopsis clavispora]|nr:hypothetical protein G7054_g5961 [Neopestalotiopsis clavispora]